MGARCSWKVRENPIVPGSPPAKYQVQWITNNEPKPVVNLGNSARNNDLKCGKDGFKAGDDVSWIFVYFRYEHELIFLCIVMFINV